MNRQAALLAAFAVLVLAACSSNPMPGERGYPYNMTGTYETSIEALGTVYAGPAEIATSPGGMIYGTVELDGPETVTGDMEGTIVADTLTWESHYERAGGCTGVFSGVGLIAEGGGSAIGEAVVDDDCAGDMFDALFSMTRTDD